MNPNMNNPTFCLKDIVNSKEPFMGNVSVTNLERLVDSILSRIQQHRVTYDHLQTSISIIHSKFTPYGNETFEVLSKIV